ncbi:hypothetical protein QBC47DRAFT_406252 [Echria macrotheca]|uniref:Galactose oxidase n=1 Tax=Echria macrotheca TaxID=438768 RepID=A0AAJ0B5W9_9PEZI|nr:hypothetical protein QBC47DRAFT_406252 [Echria macrotheca]
MLNLRRFLYEAVALSDPDAGSDPESVRLVPGDLEKTGYRSPSVTRSQKPVEKTKQLPVFIKVLLLISVVALAVFLGGPIANFAALTYKAVVQCSGPHHRHAPIVLDDAPLVGQGLAAYALRVPAATPAGATEVSDRSGWKPNCSSTDSTTACENAIGKGKDGAVWKSQNAPGTTHSITIDFGKELVLHSVVVWPAEKLKEGAVRKHLVEVRTKEGTWQLVARGTWRQQGGAAIFEPFQTQQVRLSVIDTYSADKTVNFVAISDIKVWTLPRVLDAVKGGGRWAETLNFPLVPVAAWLNPKKGQLVTAASYTYDRFDKTSTKTLVAEVDLANGDITEKVIGEIKHNVFCPGTSMDANGRVIFTGGSTAGVYSIYDLDKGWIKPNDNEIEKKRGYQGQTYLSDGRTFMIGGTWSGPEEPDNKDGEIFVPDEDFLKHPEKGGNWTLNENLSAASIKMSLPRCEGPLPNVDGCAKNEWRQHHPWLFAWKGATVFHAGPSRNMNWFFTENSGKTKPAGKRNDDPDGDAVCGAAVMYDAVKGSIITAGGAPNYHYWLESTKRGPNDRHRLSATNKVFGMTLTLGAPGEPVSVKTLEPMLHKRIFANAAILPNGEIFVVGGQTLGEPFYDDTGEASSNSIPRAYHSWALLLPDATVLVGGGDLDIDHPETNHYDAQIYQPAYLFTPDGKGTAARPKILDDNVISEHKLGTTITIQTDVEVNLEASLIRYSSVTHALNNDLRRIPLTLVVQGKLTDRKYAAQLPDDPGVALPGYYMLFVLRDGVPSHAKTVRLFNK